MQLSDDFDTVTDEVERWSKLDKAKIREFRDDDGIVNEFALMYNVRSVFPLHYIVFKQTASHLPHEGNSEQLFSRSGALSDDNGKMDPVCPVSNGGTLGLFPRLTPYSTSFTP